MKVAKIIVLGLGLLISAGAVARYAISQNAEQQLDQHMARTQRFLDQQNIPIRWEKVSYQNSFSAEFITKLVFTGDSDSTSNEPPAVLHLKHNGEYGPIFFSGKPMFAVARWESELDLTKLEEQPRAELQTAFSGQAPLQMLSAVGFDAQLNSKLELAAFAVLEEDTVFSFSGLQASFNIAPDNSGYGQALIGSLLMRSDEAQLSVSPSSLAFNVGNDRSGLAPGTLSWSMERLSIEAPDQMDLAFSAALNSQSSITDGVLAAEASLTLSDIEAPLPMNGVRLDLAYGGIAAQSFSALQQLLQSGDSVASPDQALSISSTQAQQMMRAMLIPGKTFFRLTAALDSDRDSSLFSLNVRYPELDQGGAAAVSPDTEQLLAMINGELDIELEQMYLNQPQAVAVVQALIEQGYVTRQADKYILNARLEDEMLTLNGKLLPLGAMGL